MNFIRSPVIATKFGCAIVLRSQGRAELNVPSSQAKVAEYVGKEVILGIRPEQLTHVIPHLVSSPNMVTITAKVNMVEPQDLTRS